MNEQQTEIEKFKRKTIIEMRNRLFRFGELLPCLNILYYFEGRYHSMDLPVPPQAMNSDSSKDRLADFVIPSLLQFIKLQGRKVICLAFATEAWFWVTDASATNMKDAEKEIDKMTKADINRMKASAKKRDTILISFETEDGCEPVMFERVGTGRNAELFEMPPPTMVTGRFTKLFRTQKEK